MQHCLVIHRFKFIFFFAVFLLTLSSCREKGNTSLKNNEIEHLAQVDSTTTVNSDSLLRRGSQHLSAGNQDSAKYFLELAIGSFERQGGAGRKLLASYYLMGKIYYDDFKFEAANKYFEQARSIASSINVASDTSFFVSLHLATCKREMKDLPTSRSIVSKTLQLLKGHNSAVTDSLIAKCYDIFSSLEYVSGNYDAAIVNLERGIQIVKKSGSHRQLNRFYSNAALIYTATEQYQQALYYIDQSIRIEKRLGSDQSDQIAISALRKGQIWELLGRPDSALYFYKMNLKIRRHVYGHKHANTWGALYMLGNHFYSMKNYDSAVLYYQRGIVSLISDFDNFDFQTNPSPHFVEAKCH